MKDNLLLSQNKNSSARDNLKNSGEEKLKLLRPESSNDNAIIEMTNLDNQKESEETRRKFEELKLSMELEHQNYRKEMEMKIEHFKEKLELQKNENSVLNQVKEKLLNVIKIKNPDEVEFLQKEIDDIEGMGKKKANSPKKVKSTKKKNFLEKKSEDDDILKDMKNHCLMIEDHLSKQGHGFRYTEKEINSQLWSFCCAFENPDYEDKEEWIDREKAASLYSKFFHTDTRLDPKQGKKEEDHLFEEMLNQVHQEGDKVLLKSGKAYVKDSNHKWIKNPENDKIKIDFLSLMRRVFVYKASKVLYLKTCQLFSVSGEVIYVLISADEETLKFQAKNKEFILQYEVASTDLISLEPTDDDGRPLRFNQNKPNEIIETEKKLEDFFQIVYGEDVTDYFNDQKIYEPIEVTSKVWESYHEFLKSLIKRKPSFLNCYYVMPEARGFLLQKLFMNALKDSQKITGTRANTLWNYFGMKSAIGAYDEFYENKNAGELDEYAPNFWQKFIIDKNYNISLFNNINRMKLLFIIIFEQINMNHMVSDKIMIEYFPLHNVSLVKDEFEELDENGLDEVFLKLKNPKLHHDEKNILEKIVYKKLLKIDSDFDRLRSIWNFSWVGESPGDEVKAYFGEKLSMFFEIMETYTQFLLYISLFGMGIFILQQTEIFESKYIEYYIELGFHKKTYIIIINVVYSMVVIVWSAIFLEVWKRKQVTLAIKWGQLKFEENELPMPTYSGKKRRSPIDDDFNETYFDPNDRLKRIILTYFITFVFIIIVFGIVILLLIFRTYLASNPNYPPAVSQIPSILSSIQIFVFNIVFQKLAHYLTHYENHKTFTEYEDALALKIFLFQFFNSYISLIIISFVKRNFENLFGGCVKKSLYDNIAQTYNFCDEELSLQMIITTCTFFINVIVTVTFSKISSLYLLSKIN